MLQKVMTANQELYIANAPGSHWKIEPVNPETSVLKYWDEHHSYRRKVFEISGPTIKALHDDRPMVFFDDQLILPSAHTMELTGKTLVVLGSNVLSLYTHGHLRDLLCRTHGSFALIRENQDESLALMEGFGFFDDPLLRLGTEMSWLGYLVYRRIVQNSGKVFAESDVRAHYLLRIVPGDNWEMEGFSAQANAFENVRMTVLETEWLRPEFENCDVSKVRVRLEDGTVHVVPEFFFRFAQPVW